MAGLDTYCVLLNRHIFLVTHSFCLFIFLEHHGQTKDVLTTEVRIKCNTSAECFSQNSGYHKSKADSSGPWY